jgi:hypothetical protein
MVNRTLQSEQQHLYKRDIVEIIVELRWTMRVPPTNHNHVCGMIVTNAVFSLPCTAKTRLVVLGMGVKDARGVDCAHWYRSI